MSEASVSAGGAPPRPVVVVTEGSDPRPLEWLRERAAVLEVKYDDPALPQALSRADGESSARGALSAKSRSSFNMGQPCGESRW